MDKSNNKDIKDIKDIDEENIKIVDNLDLNSLFNLTYNFDLLKGVLTTILKNQETFKKQIEKEKKNNFDQSRAIESLKGNILSIKENYMTKEQFQPTKYQIDDINLKINQLDEKILQMEEEFAKSK